LIEASDLVLIADDRCGRPRHCLQRFGTNAASDLPSSSCTADPQYAPQQRTKVKTALKVGLATAAFAVAHSLLASHAAKGFAARLVGRRRRDGMYRVFYNAQALTAFGLLVAYVSHTPSRTLYLLRGTAAGAMRAGQLAGLVWAYRAAREVGILRLAGLTNLVALLRGEPIPSGPAAQGPERQPSGALSTGGPFQWSRHPLNVAAIPVFWLAPHLTTRRLAFNVVATAYLVLGSRHEEHRLRSLYDNDYEAYRGRGVPFFLPGRSATSS
jgi:protein-S-isoprenylcysteine O-methyltransferase Ste14